MIYTYSPAVGKTYPVRFGPPAHVVPAPVRMRRRDEVDVDNDRLVYVLFPSLQPLPNPTQLLHIQVQLRRPDEKGSDQRDWKCGVY